MPESAGLGPGITIVGLGPGGAELLTRRAWDVLEKSQEVYLRTRQHPAAAGLPSHLTIHSFDETYESAASFAEVYEQIITTVLELGRRPEGVLYAVPGHPYVAEATAPEIVRRARAAGLPVQVIEGLSFLEPSFTLLGIDPLPQLSLADALDLAAGHAPLFPPSAPALVAQLYSPAVASDVKLTLMANYPDEHPVVLLHSAGAADQVIEHLKLYEIDRSEHIGLLTSLYVPALHAAASFEAFHELVAHLRAPEGCPWDRQQTHHSLRRYLLEEAYETLTALDAEDPAALKEELGDLLLQIVLHGQIAAEAGEFSLAEVLQTVHQKLVRRHPHVFGEVLVENAGEVLQNWERLKAEERQANGKAEASLLDGVALALPALVQASEYLERVARVGFDWPDIQAVIAKLEEELGEVYAAKGEEDLALEIGDLFFTAANLARWHKVDPESALREANQRFKRRFGYIEAAARAQNRPIETFTLDEMLSLWRLSKN